MAQRTTCVECGEPLPDGCGSNRKFCNSCNGRRAGKQAELMRHAGRVKATTCSISRELHERMLAYLVSLDLPPGAKGNRVQLVNRIMSEWLEDKGF